MDGVVNQGGGSHAPVTCHCFLGVFVCRRFSLTSTPFSPPEYLRFLTLVQENVAWPTNNINIFLLFSITIIVFLLYPFIPFISS